MEKKIIVMNGDLPLSFFLDYKKENEYIFYTKNKLTKQKLKHILSYYHISHSKIEIKEEQENTIFPKVPKRYNSLYELSTMGYMQKAFHIWNKKTYKDLEMQNLKILSKMDSQTYLEVMLPYLINEGFEFDQMDLILLFQKDATNAKDLSKWIEDFFIKDFPNIDFPYPELKEKSTLEEILKEVKRLETENPSFILDFYKKFGNHKNVHFSIEKYLDLLGIEKTLEKLN